MRPCDEDEICRNFRDIRDDLAALKKENERLTAELASTNEAKESLVDRYRKRIEKVKAELAAANETGQSLMNNLLPAIEYLQAHGEEHGIEWGGSITEWIGKNLPRLIEELAAMTAARDKFLNLIVQTKCCVACPFDGKCSCNNHAECEDAIKRWSENKPPLLDELAAKNKDQ